MQFDVIALAVSYSELPLLASTSLHPTSALLIARHLKYSLGVAHVTREHGSRHNISSTVKVYRHINVIGDVSCANSSSCMSYHICGLGLLYAVRILP